MAQENLTDRVAIVTGGSRGIGRVCALALAKAGCHVVIAAKSTEESEALPGSIYSVAAEVAALGRQSLAIQTDVRDESAIQSLVDQTVAHFGRLDIVVNNAGVLWWKDLLETPVKRFDLLIDINVRGPFLLAQAALPHMLKNNWGHIINMSPPIDMKLVPGKIAYFISKYGMTMIAHGLAGELSGRNVACNALWPATLIESQATKNWGLGDASLWRKADIIADALIEVCRHKPESYKGQALIDEDVLRAAGVQDLSIYNCVPGAEPMRIVDGPSKWGNEARLAKAESGPSAADTWRCVQCYESVDQGFDVCWNCGTHRDGTKDPNFGAPGTRSAGEVMHAPISIPGLTESGDSSGDMLPIVEEEPER